MGLWVQASLTQHRACAIAYVPLELEFLIRCAHHNRVPAKQTHLDPCGANPHDTRQWSRIGGPAI